MADAEDIAAETFLALTRVKNWNAVKNQPGYLYRAAANTLVRFKYRDRRLQDQLSGDPMYELHDRSVDPPANVHAKEILGAMRSLPPKQRAVMALRIDGYSHAEIAHVLGLTEAAVRQNVSRSRQTLRTLLDDEEEEEDCAPRSRPFPPRRP